MTQLIKESFETFNNTLHLNEAKKFKEMVSAIDDGIWDVEDEEEADTLANAFFLEISMDDFDDEEEDYVAGVQDKADTKLSKLKKKKDKKEVERIYRKLTDDLLIKESIYINGAAPVYEYSRANPQIGDFIEVRFSKKGTKYASITSTDGKYVFALIPGNDKETTYKVLDLKEQGTWQGKTLFIEKD